MSIRNAAAIALLATGGCTLPNQDTSPRLDPLCVAGLHPGQTLKVRLGAVWDASSDYLYDATIAPASGTPSCNGADGLTAGSVVTLTPQKELSWTESTTIDCAPLGQFDPASLEDPVVIGRTFFIAQDVTIAGALSTTTFQRAFAYRFVGLFTPAKNATGTLTPRALPPLVVSRSIEARDTGSGCSDTWVATWLP